MTTIVAINGPPNSGKDAIADRLGYMSFRCATTMRKACAAMLGQYDGGTDAWYESAKNTPQSSHGGMTLREMMIWYSEEMMKPKFGVDYFGQQVIRTIREWDGSATPDQVAAVPPPPALVMPTLEMDRAINLAVDNLYITERDNAAHFYTRNVIGMGHRTAAIVDCGFDDEFIPIIESFGADNVVLLRIHRDGCDFSGDSRGYLEERDCRVLDVHNKENKLDETVQTIRWALAGITEGHAEHLKTWQGAK